jgi:transposase-like protein
MQGEFDIKEVCEAMRKVDVTDPESQDGINFCTDHCPYNFCVLAEKEILQELVHKDRITKSLELHNKGVSIQDIALIFGVKKETIQGWIRERLVEIHKQKR